MERFLAEILFVSTLVVFVGGITTEVITGIAAGIRNGRRLHHH